jgi:hypothetical protein
MEDIEISLYCDAKVLWNVVLRKIESAEGTNDISASNRKSNEI